MDTKTTTNAVTVLKISIQVVEGEIWTTFSFVLFRATECDENIVVFISLEHPSLASHSSFPHSQKEAQLGPKYFEGHGREQLTPYAPTHCRQPSGVW